MASTPGIGARIRSRWVTRQSLTREPDRRFATAMHRWFFGTAVQTSAMTLPSAMMPVSSGWVGNVTVSLDGSGHTIAVPDITSPLQVVDRIVRAGSRRGGVWSWSIAADGTVTINASVPFELVFEPGTTRDRMGFDRVYAAETRYSALLAAPPLLTSLGMLLAGADQVGRTGGVTQAETVAAAATGLRDPDANGTLRIYGTPSEVDAALVALEADDTWDVALGDQVVRVRVVDLSRETWGKAPLRLVLVATVMAVSE